MFALARHVTKVRTNNECVLINVGNYYFNFEQEKLGQRIVSPSGNIK